MTNPEPPAPIPPPLGLLLRVWFSLGMQSFGGGVATLALIRRAVVERYRCLPEAEFTRCWSLAQVVPGINLFALTLLIGKRLAGWRGMGVCLLGLLLPSVTITILLTACYVRVERLEIAQAALRGMIPASVGLGLLTAVQIARPLLRESHQEGATSLLVSLLLMVGGAAVFVLVRPPVVAILLAASSLSALFHWRRSRRRPPP